MKLEEKHELVKYYYQSGESYAATLRKFKTVNKLIDDPFPVSTVRRLIEKFIKTGSLLDLPRPGRPSVSEEIVESIKTTLMNGQSQTNARCFSAHKVSKTMDIPYSTIRRVLKDKLQFHPYRISIVQELKLNDHQDRIQFL